MKKVYLVSVSGGKDSQACWIYIKKHYESKGCLVVPYFADTGWEAEETYEHLVYLEEKLGKLITISSDKYDGFEDMCIQKKGFPSRIRRFCTQELKIIPSEKFIRSWQERGFKVVNIVGVRREESISQKLKTPIIKNGVRWWFLAKRDIENRWKTNFMGTLPAPRERKNGTWNTPKKAKEFYSKKNSVTVFQPVVEFTEAEIYDYNTENKTKNNPLYQRGFTRVGCFPCINANTKEIGFLPKDRADRVKRLEEKVQATTIKTKPVFFHKSGELLPFEDYYAKYTKKFNNALGFDLGCINHLGKCE